LALFFASLYPDRCRGVLCLDPLGAVGDGGEGDLEANLEARLTPEARERAEELDRRAMAGEGAKGDAVEGLRLVWPGYFADPASAPPMPDLDLSVECYSQTLDSSLSAKKRWQRRYRASRCRWPSSSVRRARFRPSMATEQPT
jgi:pimeloyl-ACP methyl ester carboxylesterase